MRSQNVIMLLGVGAMFVLLARLSQPEPPFRYATA